MKAALIALALVAIPSVAFGQSKDAREMQDRYFRGMQEFYNNNSYDRSIMMQQSIMATQQAQNAMAAMKKLQDEKEVLEAQVKFYKGALERARKAADGIEQSVAKDDDVGVKKWLAALKQVIRP